MSFSITLLSPSAIAAIGSANGEVSAIEMSLRELHLWAEKEEHIGSYLAEKDSLNVRFMMEKGYTRSGLLSYSLAPLGPLVI
jgi:hypothetical protein